MLREIVFYPDPLLYEVSVPVTPGTFPFRGQTAAEIEQDLKDTLAFTKGAAIAGIQIGVPLRVMVIGDTVYWNPVVVNTCRCMDESYEGCLSMPGVMEKVWRFCTVEVQYQATDGTAKTATLKDIQARAALHEIEHMDGKLLTSVASPVKLKKLRTQMKQLSRYAAANGLSLTRLVYRTAK